MRKFLKSKKGFTIVELIIVIAVLAVLSVIAVVAYSGFQQSSRQSLMRTEASSLAAALNNFNAATSATTRIDSDAKLDAIAIMPMDNTGRVVLETIPPTSSPIGGQVFTVSFSSTSWQGTNRTPQEWRDLVRGYVEYTAATGRWDVKLNDINLIP